MKDYIRLNITTEGQSEHLFVKEVLSKHLFQFNIFCEMRSVLTSKEYRKRGGLSGYQKARKDIIEWLRSDQTKDARFTTMFDFYGLPKDFPGMNESKKLADPYEKVKIIEKYLNEDINDRRFFAYIQLHEFEALLFTRLDTLLLEYETRNKEVEDLKRQLASKGGNPEMINDKKETSPSHRIMKLIPEFQKVDSGAMIIDLIGLEEIREACRHFDEWIQKLEKLNVES